jgi:hypothetical protein
MKEISVLFVLKKITAIYKLIKIFYKSFLNTDFNLS